MTPRVLIAALAMLLLPPAQFALAQTATPTIAPGTGVLEGTVTRGPIAPVARPGVRNEAAVSGAQIVISPVYSHPPEAGFTFIMKSAADGSYSIQLPPGEFEVSIASPKSPFGKKPPSRVTITAGQRTHLDLHIDTGIR